MRKALVLLFLAAPCLAGPTVTLMGGGAFPLSKIEITGGGKDDIGTAGGAGGLQVMFPVNERMSAGLDILSQNFGEKTSDVIFAPARATYQLNALTCLAGGRLEFPSGKTHPFVFAGLGFHSSKLQADLEPTPGLVWSDTGTREKRRIIDNSGTGFASALAGGVDYDVSSVIRFGLEARYSYMGETTWTTRSISSVFSTVGEIKGSSAALSLLARLSLRF